RPRSAGGEHGGVRPERQVGYAATPTLEHQRRRRDTWAQWTAIVPVTPECAARHSRSLRPQSSPQGGAADAESTGGFRAPAPRLLQGLPDGTALLVGPRGSGLPGHDDDLAEHRVAPLQ